MVAPLETIGMQDLLEMPLEDAEWVVEDFLPVGLTLLCGSPKMGKSWFALLLALCVCSGDAFMGRATAKGAVLCLFLEDTYKRIQKRAHHLVDESSNDLRLAIRSEKIGSGLVEQLEFSIEERPDLCLVIVDTLQTVRTATSDSVYAADYQDLSCLKRFADEHGVAVLVIHHTRKMTDGSNVFNTVSGSNGIMGSADATMILSKNNFFESQATLSVTGRDVESAEFKLRLQDCRWTLIEQTSQEELQERSVPEAVLVVLDFMSNRVANWEGTSLQLIREAGVQDVATNVLTKLINQHRDFLASRGVSYELRKTREARLIRLIKVDRESESTADAVVAEEMVV